MPKVKAAVLERTRRSTAGKRMASLVGKAQENDDTFWSHSIWSESGGGFSEKGSRKRRREEDMSSSGAESGDDDSESDGEGSYRMSDEDPDVAVDTFDSDFDESESDDDEGDAGEGEEEQELRMEERREALTKRQKNHVLGSSLKSAGRELMKKKTGKMTKRGPLGEGWNEGLVLNRPPPSSGAVLGISKPDSQTLNSKSTDIATAQGSTSMSAVANAKPQHVPSMAAIERVHTSRWSTRNLRTGTSLAQASSTKPALKRKTASTSKEKKTPSKKRQFTQEELILESVTSTEVESAKWLSFRKRRKEDASKFAKATAAGNNKSSLNHKVFRFHSRRGCSNTLTFLEMDHLPDILSRKPASSRSAYLYPSNFASKRQRLLSTTSETAASAQTTDSNCAQCVITGKAALYRDPKTMFGYHDVDSYKEIQHRLETGELTVPKYIRSEDKMSTLSRSNDRASDPQSSPNNRTAMVRSKHYIPFVAEPTMIAKTKGSDLQFFSCLKVMVTQGGVPVSPPNTRIHLKSSSMQHPSWADGSQNHDYEIANNDSTMIKDVPHLQSVHYQSAPPGKTEVLVEAAGNVGINNEKADGAQNQTVSGSASDTVAVTVLRDNGTAANGSTAYVKSPSMHVVSRNTADGNKDDFVNEKTTSNDKRATIKAH